MKNKKISLRHLGYGQLSNERAIEMKNLLKMQINLFKTHPEIFMLLRYSIVFISFNLIIS